MEQLQKLITPDVYSYQMLKDLGWSIGQINEYMASRKNKWCIARRIFIEKFAYLGRINAWKEFSQKHKCMTVIVIKFCDDYTIERVCTVYHPDPLFALAECAKEIDASVVDDYLMTMLSEMSISA